MKSLLLFVALVAASLGTTLSLPEILNVGSSKKIEGEFHIVLRFNRTLELPPWNGGEHPKGDRPPISDESREDLLGDLQNSTVDRPKLNFTGDRPKLNFTGDREQFIHKVIGKIKEISDKLEVKKWFAFNRLVILVLHCTDEELVQKIYNLTEVDSIESNLWCKVRDSCMTQNSADDEWGLSRIAVRDRPRSFRKSTYQYKSQDGKGTTVYIVDTGIYTENRDFEGRAYHGYTAEGVKSEGDQDLNGHGTHCAGVTMGKTYGVAKAAKSVAVKVMNGKGTGSVSDFLDGLEWVYDNFTAQLRSNKDYRAVASMSLGIPVSRAVNSAVQEVYDAGLPMAVAAGNEDENACGTSPASSTYTVTVGASNPRDGLASFSNWGSCLDIIAPGVDILSTYIGGPTATKKMSGTSMATPFVAGAILRYMSQTPSRPSPEQVKKWLIQASTPNFIRQASGSPNRLLYAPCDLTNIPTHTTNVRAASDDGGATWLQPASMLTLCAAILAKFLNAYM